MQIGILVEIVVGENCVVVMLEMVKKLISVGYSVVIECRVGVKVVYIDSVYE